MVNTIHNALAAIVIEVATIENESIHSPLATLTEATTIENKSIPISTATIRLKGIYKQIS